MYIWKIQIIFLEKDLIFWYTYLWKKGSMLDNNLFICSRYTYNVVYQKFHETMNDLALILNGQGSQ